MVLNVYLLANHILLKYYCNKGFGDPKVRARDQKWVSTHLLRNTALDNIPPPNRKSVRWLLTCNDYFDFFTLQTLNYFKILEMILIEQLLHELWKVWSMRERCILQTKTRTHITTLKFKWTNPIKRHFLIIIYLIIQWNSVITNSAITNNRL